MKAGTLAASLLALAGLGFIVSALVFQVSSTSRLFLGIVLLVAGLITAGASTLLFHGGSATEEGT